MTLYDWCKERKDDTLLREWDTDANNGLSPRYVGTGSNYKAFWRCQKGHLWQKSVMKRVPGAGCPICANRKVMAEVNDLATTHPEIVAEWNFQRNGDLQPTEVVAGTHRKVWWRCREHPDHEWQADVIERAKRGKSCPYCTGIAVLQGFNDLASRYPLLAAEWYQPLNRDLTPETVMTYGSQRTAAWKCGSCGCVRYARIDARTRKNGTGCPACAGQLNRAKIAYYGRVMSDAPRRRRAAQGENRAEL